MTPAAFRALAAEGYNRIPVSLEVLADQETPVSTYRKLANGPYSYLFESDGSRVATLAILLH